ncbi:40S ribosomal protein S30-B [Drechslerella dactyloides]|uniref:40S ribosomal protein S30-B n=1 Tax=Drechslerella dactyloides TaxID=74499 RepID=A0AAD6NHY9_DREDA|nr:40S ribosomal protein S30-B [Drechslerella dactyloides]
MIIVGGGGFQREDSPATIHRHLPTCIPPPTYPISIRKSYYIRINVHGSLARAGKVKSQTPKVEPQEKKKTPKGRAKKRILYTRRFVNVTLTGGKRKVSIDSRNWPFASWKSEI